VAAAHTDAIAFLAPGLVHQFGNLLLMMQGHAATLEPDTVARSRPALLGACERGSAGLRVFRQLLGDGEVSHLDAGAAATMLAELLRIPVREAGHTFELAPPTGAAGGHVELAAFVLLVVTGVQAVVRSVPSGVNGTVELALTGQQGLATARIAFRAPAGTLPFPLPLAEAAARVGAAARRAGHRAEVRGTTGALELTLPASTGVIEA
jgi:hypothetical protein